MVCIPKSVTPSRILQNLQVCDFSLSEEDMRQVEALDRGERYIVPAVEVRRAGPDSSGNTAGETAHCVVQNNSDCKCGYNEFYWSGIWTGTS